MAQNKREYDEKQKENYKRWLQKQAQISIKIDSDLKKQIDDHVNARGESIRSFVLRAIQNQISNDGNP